MSKQSRIAKLERNFAPSEFVDFLELLASDEFAHLRTSAQIIAKDIEREALRGWPVSKPKRQTTSKTKAPNS